MFNTFNRLKLQPDISENLFHLLCSSKEENQCRWNRFEFSILWRCCPHFLITNCIVCSLCKWYGLMGLRWYRFNSIFRTFLLWSCFTLVVLQIGWCSEMGLCGFAEISAVTRALIAVMGLWWGEGLCHTKEKIKPPWMGMKSPCA